MENVHKGHRERLKMRFREHGLESFTDIEAIELLLFYAIPRRDTNALAHALLNRFGSFRAVLEAKESELAAVKGVGENAASLLALVASLNSRYLSSERKRGEPICSTEAAGNYLKPFFAYRGEEMALLLCLDSASRVISCHSLGKGSINSVELTARDVVDIVLRQNAVRVVLAHNHLSGTALPSNADVATTEKMFHALRLIGVELTDHIIVCDDDFVSMRDSGFFTRF